MPEVLLRRDVMFENALGDGISVEFIVGGGRCCTYSIAGRSWPCVVRKVVHHFYTARRKDPVIGPLIRAHYKLIYNWHISTKSRLSNAHSFLAHAATSASVCIHTVRYRT